MCKNILKEYYKKDWNNITMLMLGFMATTRGEWIVFKLFSQILGLEWSSNKQLRKAVQKTNSIVKQKLESEIQSVKIVI